ncbi:MAG: hypothetical protein L0H70_04810, partial [Xanthomonadales bacterium]|nr:hypothetical protein [Xanthomonadales bacterium]
MREELRGRRVNQLQDGQPQPSDNVAPTRFFTSVCTSELSTPERQELLDKLNKSYKDFRIDYLVMCFSGMAFVAALFSQNPIAILILAAVGVIASVAASLYEAKSRTVQIAYDFKSDDISS